MKELYTEEEVDAALCLWEECLLRRQLDQDHMFGWLAGGEGCCAARTQCIMLSSDLEACWQIAHEHFGFDDSFDWEFVPRWADLAMELTEEHDLVPVWWPYLAYKVTEAWKYDTCRTF